MKESFEKTSFGIQCTKASVSRVMMVAEATDWATSAHAPQPLYAQNMPTAPDRRDDAMEMMDLVLKSTRIESRVPWIEESEQPEIAESRDYYSVPSVFFEGRKLYEAHFTHSYGVIKEKLRKAFDEVLSA